MRIPILTIAALAIAGAAPASAATYSAKPAMPVKEARIAVRDMLWTCGDSACSGATANSRPLVLCQSLAKEAGRIDSFTVDGRPISDSDLERCNAAARGETSQALANAR